MNIYKLTQNINNDYDTYDSIIVCAESPDEARLIHPSSSNNDFAENDFDEAGYPYSCWVNKDQISKIKVKLVGVASREIKKGVLLASFNAG